MIKFQIIPSLKWTCSAIVELKVEKSMGHLGHSTKYFYYMLLLGSKPKAK